MPTQRLLHAIPVSILPRERLQFVRTTLQPGVHLQSMTGPLSRQVAQFSERLPISTGFVATHLIVVHQNEYLSALDERLAKAGSSRNTGQFPSVDLDGIARQVLVAITLCGRGVWEVAGHHTFDYSDADFPYGSAGYGHRPTQRVSDLLKYASPNDWFLNVAASNLRSHCNKLDCYYRSGSWWVDRLSVALGYLWSGLTTTQPELSFAALCMSIEAIASTSHNEITHILAERCAVLISKDTTERLNMYREVKDLYSLRSKIIHGRSAPRRGAVNWETLAITAKRSLIPVSALFRMLGVTVSVINSVLSNAELMAILHVRRDEDHASKALDEYFHLLILRREAL